MLARQLAKIIIAPLAKRSDASASDTILLNEYHLSTDGIILQNFSGMNSMMWTNLDEFRERYETFIGSS